MTQAAVAVDGECIARVDKGLLVLVAAERGDSDATAGRLLDRLLAYRVFADRQGRMNRSLHDIAGGLLLVPQFTLAANTRKGNRPGFSAAAEPALARQLFETMESLARTRHNGPVQSGRFGADMQVSLVNDGPVSFWLQVSPATGEENA